MVPKEEMIVSTASYRIGGGTYSTNEGVHPIALVDLPRGMETKFWWAIDRRLRLQLVELLAEAGWDVSVEDPDIVMTREELWVEVNAA